MNDFELLRRFCFDPAPPRAMIVAAHFDDEAIGLGAQLPRLREAWFVHASNSAPLNGFDAHAHGFANLDDYADARRQEFASALALAGLALSQTREMDAPDGGVARHLEHLAREIAQQMLDSRPEIVITHPYEGGHPDHDATAFCAFAACELLRRGGHAAPVRLEMTSYFANEQGMQTGAFLPSTHEVVTLPLSPEQCEFKARVFACYKSQADVLRDFPIRAEAFRVAPNYDFSQAPHAGRLNYEGQSWGAGFTGARMCQLMREAARELDIALC